MKYNRGRRRWFEKCWKTLYRSNSTWRSVCHEAKDTEAIRACNSVREHLDSPHQETVSSACTLVNKETGTWPRYYLPPRVKFFHRVISKMGIFRNRLLLLDPIRLEFENRSRSLIANWTISRTMISSNRMRIFERKSIGCKEILYTLWL